MSTPDPGPWSPLGANRIYDVPPVGALVALGHGVWRVTAVEHDPGRLHAEWVGGARPAWAEPDQPNLTGRIDDPRRGSCWYVYPASGRWPMCSCCGEPMPCRNEMQDRTVGHALATVEKWATRRPGGCWGCGEPITGRQKTVEYPGENLDLPGSDAPRFHTRRQCWGAATAYERRWIAVDPRRERILTYPRCDGILIVHGDGSSECTPGRNVEGAEKTGEPDCRGHLTHDHGTYSACYVAGRWFADPSEWETCPRGCSRLGHPGTATSPRPLTRTLGGTA